MFGSFIRKVFVGLTALFWADKKRLFLSLFTSIWAVQHIACAYGTDEPCENCIDPSLDCSPIFDVSKLSGEGYSGSEAALAEDLKFLAACDSVCSSGAAANQGFTSESRIGTLQYYCSLAPDSASVHACTASVISNKNSEVDDLFENGDMSHIRDEGALAAYQCANGETVSVEEGERRSAQYNELSAEN